jgi:hypothetical protein
VTSIASSVGYDEAELRQRIISLVAYALSNRELRFPESEDHQQRTAGYPSPVAAGTLSAEAAMAMAGAASCALVLDQRVGVRLAWEAATLYADAGQPYAAFLQGALGRIDERWTRLASRVAEGGLAQLDLPPQLFASTQLGYLGLGAAFSDTPGVGLQILTLTSTALAFGSTQIPIDLLRQFVGEIVGRQERGYSILAGYLISAIAQEQIESQRMPHYRRLLPWNVGLPLDAILLLTRALPAPADHPDERLVQSEREDFGELLVAVALEIERETRSMTELEQEPLDVLLQDWLA